MDAVTGITVGVPFAVPRRGGRKVMIMPEDAAAVPTRGDPAMLKALARALRWRRLMETGRFATLNELAVAAKINSSYVSRLLRLTLLAPEIVEAILDGRKPEGMTLPALTEPIPVEWAKRSVT